MRFSRIANSIFLSLLATAAAAKAQYTNGQNASGVLGQANYTANGSSSTQSTFFKPASVALDPSTKKLFVVDTSNNRILRFSSANALASGTAAEAVFGQPNFTVNTAAATATGLSSPQSAFVDSNGNLWVADQGNNRVVRYANGATVTGVPTASAVLGQSSVTSATNATTQSGMFGPTAVAVNSSGSLFVMDRQNNRVLRFDGAASLATGANASGVIGQSNFLSNSSGASANQFSANPFSLAIDSSDNLWVADSGSNRVLEFTASNSYVSGSSASVVLGQSNFTSTSGGFAADKFAGPVGLAFDALDNLYVADSVNNRVVFFNAASLTQSSSSASLVLGQSSFSTNSANTTQAGLNNPTGVSTSPDGYLFVADQNNNRVLSFATLTGTPVLQVPSVIKVKAGKTKTFKITVYNQGAGPDAFTMTAFVASNISKNGQAKFLYQGTDITAQIKSGAYVTPQIAASGSLVIDMQVKAKLSAKGSKVKFNVGAVSSFASGSSAQINSQIQFQKASN